MGPCCADSLFRRKEKNRIKGIIIIILNMQSRVREKGAVPAMLLISVWKTKETLFPGSEEWDI